ncbi:MAG: hypothetical protein HWD61_02445 [Parachlamydiaceae bacterium]|nr:MAG: hypothetical protein HWD61_02445 [Parachlamydiaceae bacterium]
MDAKNIKHRDLKPDNLVIKIDESGEKHLKIADFGYAITSDAKADDAVKFVGTPTYIPPEIFEAYSLLNEGKSSVQLVKKIKSLRDRR